MGTLGQKRIFRFRVKLKAEVISVEEWGKGCEEGFFSLQGNNVAFETSLRLASV